MTRPVLFALLAACGGDDSDHFPINPGGGGVGGGIFVDAAVEPDDASRQITGRVCLLEDARLLTACATSGAEDLTVALDTELATTAADGSFSIERPDGANLVWRVTGVGIEPSAMSVGPGEAKIPAVSTALYADMIANTLATVSVDTGAIIAQLSEGGVALPGAVVSPAPAPDGVPLYDGPNALDWENDATGALGVTWISSIAPGTASLAVDTGAAVPTAVTGIPVFAGTITFELAEIP